MPDPCNKCGWTHLGECALMGAASQIAELEDTIATLRALVEAKDAAICQSVAYADEGLLTQAEIAERLKPALALTEASMREKMEER